MGSPSRGGSGCMCPEASFMKALLGKLLLQEDESVVLDMEAGVEHLGRGTAGFVEHLFIVTESNINSIDAAKKIWKLAKDLKIKEASVIVNKVRKDKDLDFVKENITEIPVLAGISFEEKLLEPDTDMEKTSVYKQVTEMKKIFINTRP
jgi:CO dehydrogenase maturation factor